MPTRWAGPRTSKLQSFLCESRITQHLPTYLQQGMGNRSSDELRTELSLIFSHGELQLRWGRGRTAGWGWGFWLCRSGMMAADTRRGPGNLQVLSLEAGLLPPSGFTHSPPRTPPPLPPLEFSLSPRMASFFGFRKGGVSSPRGESFLSKQYSQGKDTMHSRPLKVILFNLHNSLEHQVLLIPRKESLKNAMMPKDTKLGGDGAEMQPGSPSSRALFKGPT